jgi:hypothetical protein
MFFFRVSLVGSGGTNLKDALDSSGQGAAKSSGRQW